MGNCWSTKKIDWDSKIPRPFTCVKDWLFWLYHREGLNLLDMAAEIGVNYKTLRRKMVELEIPRRGPGGRPL